MRPQRAAKVAAVAAIAETAASDAIVTDSVPSKSLANADRDSAPPVSPASSQTFSPSPTPELDPEYPIYRLPTEILLEIVSYLDDSPVSILHLLFVCKAFRKLLLGPTEGNSTLGKRAIQAEQRKTELAWKRRVATIRSDYGHYITLKGLRKSNNVDTWYETFMRTLGSRCIRCCGTTSAKFGLLWPWAPQWAVMCRGCQYGPFRCVQACQVSLDEDELVEKGVPFKWVKNDDYGTVRYAKKYFREFSYIALIPYIRAKQAAAARRARELEEARLKAEREAEEAAKREEERREEMFERFKGNKEHLRDAIAAVEGDEAHYSWKLPNLVRVLLAQDPFTATATKAVASYYGLLLAKQAEVEDELEPLGLFEKTGYPSLGDKYTEKGRLTHLDHLVGKGSVEQFVAMVRAAGRAKK